MVFYGEFSVLPQASNRFCRSPVVSDWHSPVVPPTKTPRTPSFAKCPAYAGTCS